MKKSEFVRTGLVSETLTKNTGTQYLTPKYTNICVTLNTTVWTTGRVTEARDDRKAGPFTGRRVE